MRLKVSRRRAEKQIVAGAKCQHCGEPFGYRIDGFFYPVSQHVHKQKNGAYLICKPGPSK